MTTDESLDRELVALLDAQVSADFVARVREQVNAHPASARSWLPARWIVGAAAIIVVVTGATMWFKPPTDRVAIARSSSSPVVEAIVEPSAVRTDEALPAAPPQRSADVLISPTESAFIQRLLIAARDAPVIRGAGRVREPPSIDPPMPLVIEPITVAPLVTADIELGGQQ